jgi:hypothetical protein
MTQAQSLLTSIFSSLLNKMAATLHVAAAVEHIITWFMV